MKAPELLPCIPKGITRISDTVSVELSNDHFTYYIFLYPIYNHHKSETNSFRYAIALLLNSGSCRVCEIVRAFGITKHKALRAVKQLKERGSASFFNSKTVRKGGTILTAEKLEAIQGCLNKGYSRGEIAERFEIKKDTLRKAINDGRLVEVCKDVKKKRHLEGV